VYPSLFGTFIADLTRSGFDSDRETAIYAIQYGLHYIPPQSGYVLTEGPAGYGRIFEDYGAKIDPAKVVVISDSSRKVSYTDATWTPALGKQINLSDNVTGLSGNYSREDELIRADILSGKYSLIMVGPPSWQIVTENMENLTDYIRANYCHISLPNFIYLGNGRSETSLYFRSRDDCQAMRTALSKYYNSDYARFCTLGHEVDNSIKIAAAWDKFSIPTSCGTSYDFLYGPSEKYKSQIWDILLALALIPPAIILVKALAPPGGADK
jgi:hypothetical protein